MLSGVELNGDARQNCCINRCLRTLMMKIGVRRLCNSHTFDTIVLPCSRFNRLESEGSCQTSKADALCRYSIFG